MPADRNNAQGPYCSNSEPFVPSDTGPPRYSTVHSLLLHQARDYRATHRGRLPEPLWESKRLHSLNCLQEWHQLRFPPPFAAATEWINFIFDTIRRTAQGLAVIGVLGFRHD